MFTKLAKIVAFVLIAFTSLTAMSQPVVVQGEDLKNLIVTEKGTTWMLSNQNHTQLSFLPGNKVFTCEILQGGILTCDDGTYSVADASIEVRHEKWFASTGGVRTVVIKKDGDRLALSDFPVIRRSEVATLLPPTPEQVAAKKSADEIKYAAKRATAEAYLQKDVIKMTAHIIDHGGISIALDVEAYPKKSKIQMFGSGSYCVLGTQNAFFSVTREGDLLITKRERMRGCGNVHILISPVIKKIRVYTSESVSFDDPAKRNINNSWTLDN